MHLRPERWKGKWLLLLSALLPLLLACAPPAPVAEETVRSAPAGKVTRSHATTAGDAGGETDPTAKPGTAASARGATATPIRPRAVAGAPTATLKTTTATSVAAPSTSTPTTTVTPVPSPTFVGHTVRKEETLLGIAASYGVTLDAVLEANALENPNFLVAGQELRIPPATGKNVLPAVSTREYGYAIIGFSGQGRALEVFSFGQGTRHLVFVGGIHGGYEWNTALLAYQMIDYFYGNQDLIPEALTLHFIPVANPDGLYRVTGREGRFAAPHSPDPPRAARFNGRGVDLNRNWSCGWSASARWGGTRVDPGSEPFSEPETRALRAFFLELQPEAVIFWHSQANLVAPGHCGGDAGSARLAEIYGEAAGYPAQAFTAYELSGTASDWLNEQGIAAATVELADHQSTGSGQNLAGIFAMLEFYGGEERAAE